MSRVILPGSYDPVTLGHLAVIKRAAELYDEVYAVIFVNPDKVYTFTEDERLEMLSAAVREIPGVKVDSCGGLVIDYMRAHGIEKIVKGYRNDADLEYEKIQAEYNLSRGGYETEFILADENMKDISSTLARTLIASDKELSAVLPESVIDCIRRRK